MSEGVRLTRITTDVISGKIRPLRDQIHVRCLKPQDSRTLYVAGSVRQTIRGVVVAVGPGCYPKRYNAERSRSWESKALRRTEVKVGDVLRFEGYDYPSFLWHDGEQYHECFLAREEDVAGIESDA